MDIPDRVNFRGPDNTFPAFGDPDFCAKGSGSEGSDYHVNNGTERTCAGSTCIHPTADGTYERGKDPGPRIFHRSVQYYNIIGAGDRLQQGPSYFHPDVQKRQGKTGQAQRQRQFP